MLLPYYLKGAGFRFVLQASCAYDPGWYSVAASEDETIAKKEWEPYFQYISLYSYQIVEIDSNCQLVRELHWFPYVPTIVTTM